MANQEHLNKLKQGWEAWNQWREQNPETEPDLSDADLTDADFRRTNLSDANLSSAYLNGANLGDADFRRVNLSNANLINANLIDANLNGANLWQANLFGANLGSANLWRANLFGANLSSAYLNGANLGNAAVGWTVFANSDLSRVKGLESVMHNGPSTIGIDTLTKSGGQIPTAFLRGCGLSDWEIEARNLYRADLENEGITNVLYEIHHLRAHQAIQINPLFISYSHKDSSFVDKIEQYLNEKGIRFWRDVHHATAGRLEKQVDRAMRLNPTVLLVLSCDSVKSDWVQHEVRLARKLEIETGRDVLCPIALDSSWKTCKWPERLREQIMEYNILDFSRWSDESFIERMFTKLINGLDLFYK